MKKTLLLSAAALLSIVALASCGEEKPNSNQEQSTSASNAYATPEECGFTRANDNSLTEPEAATTAVKFHFTKGQDYSEYTKLFVYVWDSENGLGGEFYPFTEYDDYGVICTVNLSAVNPNATTGKIGFIVTSKYWTKDVSADRFVEIAPTNHGGIQHAYLRSGIEKVFPTLETAMKNSIAYVAYLVDDRLAVQFNLIDSLTLDQSKLIVKNGDDNLSYSIVSKNEETGYYLLQLEGHLDLKKASSVSYVFDETWTDVSKINPSAYFNSTAFASEYTYDGDDLGATFDNDLHPTKTIFKLWAPTSESVVLNLYESGDYRTNEAPRKINLEYTEKGVWKAEVGEDLDGKYYTYTITNSRGTNEVVDPYAKSAGLNGRRGMVVNFQKINDALNGWSADARPDYGVNGTDASIYEIHVRDMTINPNSGVSEANRGKFLGLSETGTTYTKGGKTVKTGLDHLEELGITHVQIQPFYDYASVDEATSSTTMSESNYNWGYDPQNYNVLEGSYSTNPSDGANRIVEFKRMVMAMHQKGININMDVVYNHTYSLDNSCLELTVPYYYHRFATNGSVYNGSGCGNEVASQRSMVNKYIRESCKFYLEEYHLSGFRFDLMGLEDNQTMIDVYQDAVAIYPKALVYGEPWTGGTSYLGQGTDATKLKQQQTVQSSLAQSYFVGSGNYVGAFNDVIRNAVRGDNGPGMGYVNGISGFGDTVANMMLGHFGDARLEPCQSLNYVSCHDNYTLYDQLIQPERRDERVLNDMYSHAESLVFVAQGVPFMQEGEDFMRSKNYVGEDGKTKYEGNSYNVGDFINDMDYELKVDNFDMFQKFQQLLALRKSHHALRLDTRADVTAKMSKPVNANGKVSFTVQDGGEELLVISALNAESVTLDGSYDLLYTSKLGRAVESGLSSIELAKNELVVLRKA